MITNELVDEVVAACRLLRFVRSCLRGHRCEAQFPSVDDRDLVSRRVVLAAGRAHGAVRRRSEEPRLDRVAVVCHAGIDGRSVKAEMVKEHCVTGLEDRPHDGARRGSLRDGSLATLRMLADTQPFIRFSRTSTLGIRVESILRYNGLDLPRKLEVDHADTLTLLVAQGLGWAITTPTCLL